MARFRALLAEDKSINEQHDVTSLLQLTLFNVKHIFM
jgi:hypothetical protein